MSALAQDLRYAFRQLTKSPRFAAVAVLTLALGIGANTAIFSVVNGLLLRPLPFFEPNRLVMLDAAGNYKGGYLEFRERSETFEDFAGYGWAIEVSLTGDGEPVRTRAANVTTGAFSLLGVDAAIGRAFLPEEEWSGQDQVVILSHGLWQERFGADPGIVGQQIRIDDDLRTVVGVMPPDLRFPSAATRLWIPAGIDRDDPGDLWGMGIGLFVARLRPGVTLEQGRAEIATLTRELRALFPWDMPEEYFRTVTVTPLRDHIVGETRPLLLVLLSAVGLVMLIACANVANLLLARAATRQREVAIRAAIGAGRWRIVRQILAESLLLAGAGGAVGVVIAAWGVQLLIARLPADTPRLYEVAVDVGVLGFAVLLTLFAGLLFGSIPAVRASREDLQGLLKEGSRAGGSRGQRRIAGALIVSEVALAVVLVVGAGLLIKSFWTLLQVDPGLRTERLVTAIVDPPSFRYEDDTARRQFFEELLGRLETLPGVQRAAIANGLPFAGGAGFSVFKIADRPDPATEGGDWPMADRRVVISEQFLAATGIPLLRGRGFTDADREGTEGVVLINESLARRYWPDEDPIGKRMTAGAGGEWRTIVGIVGNVKYGNLADDDEGAFYSPFRQAGTGAMRVAVRTEADPAAIMTSLPGVVAALDQDTPVTAIRTMDELVSSSVAERRFGMLLLVAFAGVALLLGAIGIYGVIAYSVNERTREIGIRMALGAYRRDVLRLVLRQAVLLAAVGVALGLAGAVAGTRVLSSLLFGVSPRDPVTFALVPLLLVGTAMLASYLPALRATRVDPAIALRSE